MKTSVSAPLKGRATHSPSNELKEAGTKY